jgi:hypothetical protein
LADRPTTWYEKEFGSQHCLLKLHGDYGDTRIMNTADEVAVYDPRIDKLLDQILDEYGLIVCGWSAEWDTALRAAIKRSGSRRFTTYWTTLGDLNSSAEELVKLRHAQIVEISSADTFFAKLSETVDSLATLSGKRPLSAALELTALKRYLSDSTFRIELHDLVKEERERVHRVLSSDRFPMHSVQPTTEEIAKRIADYESLTELIRDTIITGCYYGESHHAPLWIACIERIANLPEPQPGYEVWRNLRHYPTLLLIYGGGIAAMAGGNYETLVGLITKPTFRAINHEEAILERINAMRVLDVRLAQTLPGMARGTPVSQHLETLLREPFRDLLPDERVYQKTFDLFEYLLAMAFMDQTDHLSWAPVGCFAWRNGFREPETANTVDREINKMGEEWPLLRAGMFGKSLTRARAIKSALDQFISNVALQHMWR